ncbi:MAG: ORF6N domain-containing protein [Acidobacteriia bacterium]|nr:ORF6N domain-containing protein [Terriglobia bacterium]
MLDVDLAELYGVPTKRLNEQVKRNRKRFPEDFMFRLRTAEARAVMEVRSQIATLKRGHHRKYLPYVFTEQGVAMLSSVLNSDRSIAVNIAIVRAFVKLREISARNKELARKLKQMEKKYDSQFRKVFQAIYQLMEPPPEPVRGRHIGFNADHSQRV